MEQKRKRYGHAVAPKRDFVVSLTLSLLRISFRAPTFSFLGTLGSARNWAKTLLLFARAWICEPHHNSCSQECIHAVGVVWTVRIGPFFNHLLQVLVDFVKITLLQAGLEERHGISAIDTMDGDCGLL